MSYSFKEKMHHYHDLLSEQHAEVDLALLKAKNPNSYVVKSSFTGRKLAEETLYNLLDFATKEEVIANRRQNSQAGDDEKAAVARLSEIVRTLKTATYEEALILKKEADDLLVAFIPEDKIEKWIAAIERVMPVMPSDNDVVNGDVEANMAGKDVNQPAPADKISGEGKPITAPDAGPAEVNPKPTAGTSQPAKKKRNTSKRKNTRR